MTRVILALVSSLACGCIAGGNTTSDAPASPPSTEDSTLESGSESTAEQASAAQTLDELERRLEGATRVELHFEIESEGAVSSQFTGTLRWEAGGELALDASGEFMGQPQELALRGDATQLRTLVGGEARWEGARPAALVEAVVIGLTRQGLLHNLAMLTGGAPPERGEGGVREWLGFVDPNFGEPQAIAGQELRALEFGIQVEGQDVGQAVLLINVHGLPVERRQRVVFPEGEMRVTERYTGLSIESHTSPE